jgi:PilZ domain
MSVESTDRRGARRLEAFEEHRIVSASVQPGHRARVIDVSAGGALIETSLRLLPGAAIELQVETGSDHTSVRGHVLRCVVVRLRPTWVCYRGAIVFERHLPWFVEHRREPTTPQVI